MPALLGRPKPCIMAHRGASDHAPENSLAAFRLAIEAGADIIETDLWLTADGVMVCHHDETVERMTGHEGRVDRMSLREVQALRLRAGDDGCFPDECIPTLAELLDLLPPHVVLAVELKDPRFAEPAVAAQLANQVEDRISTRDIVALSFEKERLRAVREVEPAFPTGHITLKEPLPLQASEVLGPYWPLIFANPLYVAWAHRLGKWVCPLDPDPHRRLPFYLRLGVDAILTNDPAATRARLEALRR